MPKLFSSLMKLQPSNVPSLWRMWTQRKSSSFLSFPLHFLFHSNSSLLAQSFSSSLIITSHLSSFLPPLSTHTQPVFFPPSFFIFLLRFHFNSLLRSHSLLRCFPLHSSPPHYSVSEPTYEVVAHSQVIVPHSDLQGLLRQLVQGYFIWKLLCRWGTWEHIYINDS